MAMIYTGRFQGRAARRKCGIITGELNEFVRQIHTRMPVILPEHQHDAWLGPTASRALRDLQSEGVIERRLGAGFDNVFAGYIAGQHMVKLGMRDLAFVARPYSAPTIEARVAGAREAMID